MKNSQVHTEVQLSEEHHIHCTLPACQGGLEELLVVRQYATLFMNMSFPVYLWLPCCHVSTHLTQKSQMKYHFPCDEKILITISVYEL